MGMADRTPFVPSPYMSARAGCAFLMKVTATTVIKAIDDALLLAWPEGAVRAAAAE